MAVVGEDSNESKPAIEQIESFGNTSRLVRQRQHIGTAVATVKRSEESEVQQRRKQEFAVALMP